MDDFAIAMQEAGISPPQDLIADGELHRFKIGDEQRKRSGWYVLHQDPPAGAYGDWRTGLSHKWSATKEYTREEKQAFAEKLAADREARAKRIADKHDDCRTKAAEIWANSSRAEDHKYIKRKCVKPYGVRFNLDSVVVPVRDIAGVLHGLQFIRQDGTKRFLPGTAKKGCYLSIGKLADTLCICEGYATGASIHEATGYPVAIAFDAGNIPTVATAFRRKFPDLKIIICADNDDVGIDRAAAAALNCGCVVVYPDGEGMDFNDIHSSHGTEAVKFLFK